MERTTTADRLNALAERQREVLKPIAAQTAFFEPFEPLRPRRLEEG